MPLPPNGLAWPPKELATVRPALAEWDAWYSGDPDTLSAVYGRTSVAPRVRAGQLAGGVVGAVSRFWWGRAQTTGIRRDQLHIPIAGDLCQASADLLYAEPPSVTVEDVKRDKATQDRIGEYLDNGLHAELAAGAEVGAALGGRFHRVTWDPDLLKMPFVSTVHADAAWPEFRWDRLVAVTFWHVVKAEGQTVLRHLERHELDGAGRGLVLHGLYQGTPDLLGVAIPLTDHPSTERLAALVDADGALMEGRTPGLCVEYIPNQRPQRKWRTDPVGKSLGRSDLDGVEPLMDALDEAWASWWRDIRLAKGRLIVPETMLSSFGPGQGAGFDLDQEVFTPLPGVLPSRESGGLPITPNQFAIRVEEHERSVNAATEAILRSAGYSAQTFGEGPEGAAVTATEVTSRERRSYLTRDRKIRHERPAVGRLIEKMLTIDVEVFRTPGITLQRPAVDFGDSVQDSILSLAQTAQALETAKAASTKVKVEMLHPDWDDEQIRDEVTLINSEHAITLADPTQVGTVPVPSEDDPLATPPSPEQDAGRLRE